LTLPYFAFPVHWLFRMFFEFRTKRFDSSKLTMVHWCELGSFITLVLWEIEKSRFKNLDARTDDLGESYTFGQITMVKIIRSV
jgi:hypothetical protein